ncbi:MAG: caspase family protein [Treponema sp.]|jgi:hypothetical protein|nr:caspase family protein [Treponema sp.]
MVINIAESREPRAESREPRAESREPRAESREPRAESREHYLAFSNFVKPSCLLFFIFFCFFSHFLPAQTGLWYALVVGVADYRYISRLTNTGKDARDAAAALNGLGCQADLRVNVTDQQFAGELNPWAVKLAASKNWK